MHTHGPGWILLVVDDDETSSIHAGAAGNWGLQAVCLPDRSWHSSSSRRTTPIRRADHRSVDAKMSGMELAQRIRRIRADLPIILYSGHGEGLAGDEVGAAGLSAVMRKPIDPSSWARC